MKEPYLSRFVQLVRSGAATRDIHDSTGLGAYDADRQSIVPEAFIEREVHRVETHRRSLCPVLEKYVGSAPHILDVGCGTGGTTIALALSDLGAEQVCGIDTNVPALEAADVRARGHGIALEKISFLHVPADEPFPFPPNSFDLVTCVSTLEFISAEDSRQALATKIVRAVRPGGHMFIATPNPLHLREYHSRLLLGDWRRRPGFPWSSSRRSIRRMFGACDLIPIARYRLKEHASSRRVSWAAPLLEWAFPWQQFLFRKR